MQNEVRTGEEIALDLVTDYSSSELRRLHPLLAKAIGTSPATGDSIEIMVVNDIADLAPGQQELTGYCTRLGLDAETINRAEVIFEELVSNAIRHGFTPGSAQSVRVRATARPAELRLTFEDDGATFNPLELASPQPFDKIENARIGGLGVAMVVRLATRMTYEAPGGRSGAGGFKPHNRTTVTLKTTR